MISKLGDALEGALRQRGQGDLWWGAKLLEVWRYVVGTRFAANAQPVLEKSALDERGLLTVAVKSSALLHRLSLMEIADRINDELGERLVHKVRFELREKLP